MRDYVVAIDLGASAVAYSWTSVTDPEIRVGVPDMQRDMQQGVNIRGKSPTALLVNGSTAANGDFMPTTVLTFGREAQRRYAENDFQPGAQLFQRFKMVRATWMKRDDEK